MLKRAREEALQEVAEIKQRREQEYTAHLHQVCAGRQTAYEGGHSRECGEDDGVEEGECGK